jgi:hypothetical protein
VPACRKRISNQTAPALDALVLLRAEILLDRLSEAAAITFWPCGLTACGSTYPNGRR